MEGSSYRRVHEVSLDEPERFWLQAAQAIDWIAPPRRAFDGASGVYGSWFPHATCNTCHNAVDRHVAAGRADQPAIIYDSPVTGAKRAISYAELLDEVATLAAVMAGHGVGKGDTVIIYMPMIPQAVFAMLACARLGAVHSVVFGGFASKELAARIDDCKPRLVLTASCGIERDRVVAYKPLLDAAVAGAGWKPHACLVFQRPQSDASLIEGRDLDWQGAIDDARKHGRRADAAAVQATDPLYVLYTSGTTGRPKGVVRDNGGHMVAMCWSLANVYGMKAGDVFWAASDVGWVVGHSYIVYAPLLLGCTTVLYEGKPVGTPDPGAFWRVIAEHDVSVLFTAPTAIRAIRKEDPEGRHFTPHRDNRLRALFLAGERADPETIDWAGRLLGVPVIDNWWQTETGWPIVANPLGLGLLPVKPGSAAVPMPGYDVVVLDETGSRVPAGVTGNICVRLPLPPGALPTLWNQDERFRGEYLGIFPEHYATADAGFIDEDGYVFILGRTDDVINVAGHRLSGGVIEAEIAAHPAVAECAVIGLKDAVKGEAPAAFIVLKDGQEINAATVGPECVRLVRERVGPVAALKDVYVVSALPKTRSGKILRSTMKKIVEGDSWTVPGTVEDAGVLHALQERFADAAKRIA